MIENVFIFPRFRGRGYLPFGTLQLLELAINKKYPTAICYIRKDRINALNEFTKLGFKIIKLVKEFRFMGMVWRTL
jgi:ribosomal protein S18 acetylase RimI-like enzyme